MKRLNRFIPLKLPLAALVLAACAEAPPPSALPDGASAQALSSPAATDLARRDGQGAVEFVVTPLNLDAAGMTLDFDVSMDSHSVDLAWDLAAQAKLTTDTGLAVDGESWPIGSGHHYAGRLSFPASTVDGKLLLDGAASLTLTIRGTDVPARVFTWDLAR